MGKFVKRLNDYSCIEKNDTIDITYLSHYTSNIKALSNICKGEFWATDIKDFGDKCEGRLILQRINEIISKLSIFSYDQKQYVYNLIGNDSKIENFISEHRTAVLSMCLDTDSDYLWDNYATENGYNIIFDKNVFVNSLFFLTANGERKGKSYVKHSKIIYDSKEQVEIIKKEINDLMALKEMGFDDAVKIEYILRHLMYVGNFYKQEYDSENQYKNEQEYRFLINTVVPTEKYPEIEEMIPKYCYNDKNNCHYNILRFDEKSIKTIVCNSRKAKENLENIIMDIPVKIRKIDSEKHLS